MRSLLIILMLCLMALAEVFSQTRQQNYFVMLNKNPDRKELPKEEAEALQAAHIANIERLAKEGNLTAAGPFDKGGGLFVLVAGSPEEANELLNTDPAVEANRFIIELYPLEMNIGGICPVGENFEMTEYQFIKYTPKKMLNENKNNPGFEKIYKKHLKYLRKTLPVSALLAEGRFGNTDGGFCVFRKTDDDTIKTITTGDPLVRSADFNAEPKVLWIAKGTFCEK